MRDSSLHSALREHVQAVGEALAAEARRGAEIPFEVLEEPAGAGRPALYCYRPLTGRFIAEREALLDALPTAVPARRALERVDGLAAYLRRAGIDAPKDPAQAAHAALRHLLGTVYAERDDFSFCAERFERAYGSLESALYRGRSVAVVVAPVLGLEIESDEVPIGDGLALMRGDLLEDAPAEAVRGVPDAEPAVLAVVRREERPGEGAAVPAARTRLRRLLTALRLYDTPGPALGPCAWARLDGGPWRMVPLNTAGRPGRALVIPPQQEDELRAFCNLVARRAPRGGEVAWALARYEMGCERALPLDALTDHLLALRALLEPEGPASGRLAQRLAVLCADAPDRPALAERAAHAVALERTVIAGLAPPSPDPDALVGEMALHLRALLRDVLCGHLDSDLVALADSLLSESVAAPA